MSSRFVIAAPLGLSVGFAGCGMRCPCLRPGDVLLLAETGVLDLGSARAG